MGPISSILIDPHPIFLIGMMGCGKSTTGEQLALLLGWPFIDLDSWIEDQQQCSIAELFSIKGEEDFRILEREALLAVLALPSPSIIACGGGAPCFFENMQKMKNSGWVIYLQTSLHLLFNRLQSEKAKRPLLLHTDLKETLHKLLLQRQSCYQQAHVVYEQNEEGMQIADDLYHHLVDISGH